MVVGKCEGMMSRKVRLAHARSCGRKRTGTPAHAPVRAGGVFSRFLGMLRRLWKICRV